VRACRNSTNPLVEGGGGGGEGGGSVEGGGAEVGQPDGAQKTSPWLGFHVGGGTPLIPGTLLVSADVIQSIPKISFMVSADVSQPIPIIFCIG
jgi:hypothetical protein